MRYTHPNDVAAWPANGGRPATTLAGTIAKAISDTWRCMLLLAISIAPATPGVLAQSVDQFTTWGDRAMTREEYYGASRFYAAALALEPGRLNLQWKQAEACRSSNQYPQAIELYHRVYQKDGGRTYRDALRWLGEMQLCDGRYSDALITWNKVLSKEKDPNSALARRARNAIAGCQLAEQELPDAEFEVSHLPAPVNTNDSEFGARPGPDSTLWFSSLRGDLNDDGQVQDTANYRVALFTSRPTAQGWSLPMQEQGPADAIGHAQANLMWAPDGARMFFTMIGGDGTKHIATRTPNGPAVPVSGLEAHPGATQPWSTTMEGKDVLFFASPGGEGGIDIWYGDLVGNTLSNIRNAGPLVNSPGNESTPSFDGATGALLFSSDYHAGLGGYDIFQSLWTSGAFAAPKNMTMLNSPANDLYPVYDALSGVGWFTSNRIGSFANKGETCCNDIYRTQRLHKTTEAHIPSTPVVDSAAEATSKAMDALLRIQQRFPLKLYFHNDEPEPRTRRTTTSQRYGQTYDAYRKLIATYRSAYEDPTTFDAFFTNEVEHGRKMLDELIQALIPALEHGEHITLDVRGHASPLARNDYNRNLSLRRIESLRNHLSTVEGGRLKTYMDSTATNGGVLRLRVLPFGEDRSASGVSDDRNDLGRSVYGVEAARERRIEVERVHLDGSSIPLGQAMHYSIDTVRQGVPQNFAVRVVNNGRTTLTINRGRTSCDCILVESVPPTLAPGGSGTIRLSYTGRTRPGPMERRIDLEVEGSPSPYTLTIHGTVIE